MTARNPRLPLTMEPSDLLGMLAADLEFLQSTFKDVDLAIEAHACCAWWNDRGGFRNPKLAFINWLKVASNPKVKSYVQRHGHDDGRGMTRGAPPMDRMAFLEDFKQRRGEA